MPDTIDDVVNGAARPSTSKEGVAGFVADNHYGWTFVPFLQAFGGNVFRNPPDDLMPALDTPEAIAAADIFARLLRDFGPDGALSYTSDQVVAGAEAGRVNYSHQRPDLPGADRRSGDSKIARTVQLRPGARGPGGPVPRRRRRMAWASRPARRTRRRRGNSSSGRCRKENTRAALVEKGYGSPTRRIDHRIAGIQGAA